MVQNWEEDVDDWQAELYRMEENGGCSSTGRSINENLLSSWEAQRDIEENARREHMRKEQDCRCREEESAASRLVPVAEAARQSDGHVLE